MVVVHLTASPFFGGPERQMLGLAMNLPPDIRPVFLSFSEGGKCRPFLGQVRSHDLVGIELRHNTSTLPLAVREVEEHLQTLRADVLCCHGYKADVIGWIAARLAGIPVVAVSRGWTAATAKVRCYESLDRLVLRWMDRVVCVSEGQAARVCRAGVPEERVAVIRNAIDLARFDEPDPAYRQKLRDLFPVPCGPVICAAGRLSPEKGFDWLVEAARRVADADTSAGFVLFGDGPMHAALARRILRLGLSARFVLAGFRDDVDRFLPHANLIVLPSLTEGLPNVALEASAAGRAVVATAVGGTPEAVRDGLNGHLVPPANAAMLADCILHCLTHPAETRAMGQRGRQWVRDHFSFTAQAIAYERLFARLTPAEQLSSGCLPPDSLLSPADPTLVVSPLSGDSENGRE
ncbi:MAG: glycosyltransferase [Phycisphaerales bacterium]|nr:glycosyltransferase [Phycisphaerales bacterium]